MWQGMGIVSEQEMAGWSNDEARENKAGSSSQVLEGYLSLGMISSASKDTDASALAFVLQCHANLNAPNTTNAAPSIISYVHK